jgi:hypothetical protein
MEPPRHKDAKENQFEELGAFVPWRFKTELQYSVFSVCCYRYLFCFFSVKQDLSCVVTEIFQGLRIGFKALSPCALADGW